MPEKLASLQVSPLGKSGSLSKELFHVERKRRNGSVEVEHGGVYSHALLSQFTERLGIFENSDSF